ncbi:hypothetical protein E8E14_001018 [Neopestalotiopsis sp. 37M]|nr:hypothetical protein E8E14_001018 [Neopestalotiopsis sp. 37M]
MVAGYFDGSLANAAAQGFAVGSADAGRPNATIADDTWAGDDQLLRNFAYLSIHEMTVVGKSLVEQFYGNPVTYAYYQGCSNGGRQGYEEAQRYPDDYQGILANAPGISWDRWLVADMFPYLVEASYNDFPGSCIWEAITAAAVESCDGLDGGLDGITDGPRDPNDDRVWGGLIPGTNFTQLAGDQPFSIARAWTAAFVEGNRTFDVEDLTASNLYLELLKAEGMFREIIGADNTDLSSFRDAGVP